MTAVPHIIVKVPVVMEKENKGTSMATTFILYVLLPIIGTVMLLMAMDKRMKFGKIFVMFCRAFKGDPPVREEDRIAHIVDPWEILDRLEFADDPYSFEFEKVNWKKEGF